MRVLVISSSVLGTIGGVEQFVRTLQAAADTPGSGMEFLFPSSGLASQLFGATAGQIPSVLSEHLTPFIREHCIDLVHSHNLVGVHLLAIDNWARKTSTPHLVTMHDVPQTGFDRRVAGALQHTRIATQSEYNRALLQQLTAEPISMLQVGIPFEDFPVCPPATDRCVALPARISPAKSIVEAIASLGQLAVEDSPVRLLLSDLRRPAFDKDDAYVDEVLDAVERWPGVAVHFVHDENGLAGLYAKAAAVLCLSKHNEGFGLTALEALAAGRPVIATPTGGMKEWLPGLPGVLELNSSRDCGEAVRRILASPTEWSQAALLGRAKVEERYNMQAVLAEHRRVYQEMLSQASASTSSMARHSAS